MLDKQEKIIATDSFEIVTAISSRIIGDGESANFLSI